MRQHLHNSALNETGAWGQDQINSLEVNKVGDFLSCFEYLLESKIVVPDGLEVFSVTVLRFHCGSYVTEQ